LTAQENAHGHWAVAALIAGVAYVLAYTQEWALFSYYPMVGEFHWREVTGEAADALGPRITYYGWKAVALLAGGLILLLPRSLTSRVSADATWIGLVLLVMIICAHEAHWFFGA
jgi:hypothetical protein